MDDLPPRGLPNPLPATLAFVVQFGAASASGEHITGRIEHVVSGRQRRFRSGAELLEALREMLTASKEEESAGGG